MRALVWHGEEDIRCDTVTDPEIEDNRNAVIKVTSRKPDDIPAFNREIIGLFGAGRPASQHAA